MTEPTRLDIYRFCTKQGTSRKPGIIGQPPSEAIPSIAAKFGISEKKAEEYYRKWRGNYVGA